MNEIKQILLTPGPVNLPQFVLDMSSNDIIHHRKSKFREIMSSINESFKKIWETKNDTYILTASGTGSMEASIVNLFSKGDKVVVINTGHFGNRLKQISEVYGLNVINLEYKFGHTYNVEDVINVLEKEKDIKGLLMTHSETSTGVVNDVKKIGELLENKTDILFVVDSISGLASNEFKFDKWNIDCAVAGSQKAFLIPPGLAFICLSDKAKERMKTSDLPKFYFDLKKYIKYFEDKQETPFTPAISLIMLLNETIKEIINRGIDNIVKDKTELRKYVEKNLSDLGFELLVPQEKDRSNSLISAVKEGVNIKAILSNLEKKGYTVTGGKGEYETKLMRVGILGDLTKQDIDKFIEVLKQEL